MYSMQIANTCHTAPPRTPPKKLLPFYDGSTGIYSHLAHERAYFKIDIWLSLRHASPMICSLQDNRTFWLIFGSPMQKTEATLKLIILCFWHVFVGCSHRSISLMRRIWAPLYNTYYTLLWNSMRARRRLGINAFHNGTMKIIYTYISRTQKETQKRTSGLSQRRTEDNTKCQKAISLRLRHIYSQVPTTLCNTCCVVQVFLSAAALIVSYTGILYICVESINRGG